MFAAVGYNVLMLRRTHIGTLSDRSLHEGKWRPLLRAEVAELLGQSKASGRAAPLEDKRKDPRTRFFATQAPQGPGPERRGVRTGEKYRRDRRRSLERIVPREDQGRRGRGDRRRKLREIGKEAPQGQKGPPKKSGGKWKKWGSS